MIKNIPFSTLFCNSHRKIAILAVLLIISISVSAQEKVYLDKDRKETNKKNAVFYRYYLPHPDIDYYYSVETYYLNDTLASVFSSKTKSRANIIGKAYWYYENGKPKFEREYFNEKLNGIETEWYENGNVKGKTFYKSGHIKGMYKRWYDNGNPKAVYEKINSFDPHLIVSYWTKDGNKIIKDGNGYMVNYHDVADTLIIESEGSYKDGFKHGVWKGYTLTGRLKYEETILDDKTTGTSWDEHGHEYPYEELETTPHYKGGTKKLLATIRHRLRYPEKPNQVNEKVVVHIGFTIDQKGQITHIESLKQSPDAYVQEVIKVIKSLTKFKAGLLRGRKSDIRIAIPITFNTNGNIVFRGD